MQAGQRVGTAVTITLGNLSGSGYPHDNSQWSTLDELYFRGPVVLPGGLGDLGPVPGAVPVGPGASLLTSAPWEYFVPFDGSGFSTYHDLGLGVAGCQLPQGPAYTGGNAPMARTCGAGSAIVFSFSTFAWFDIADFQSLTIKSHGVPVGGSTEFQTYCDVDFTGGTGGIAGTACANVEITPEPVTIALLGTGLLGVGGATLRRRKEREGAD